MDLLTIVTVVPVRDVDRHGNMQRDRPVLVPAIKTFDSEPGTHVTPLGGLSPPAPPAGWTDSGSGPLSALVIDQKSMETLMLPVLTEPTT
jgi:hypothetical protein